MTGPTSSSVFIKDRAVDSTQQPSSEIIIEKNSGGCKVVGQGGQRRSASEGVAGKGDDTGAHPGAAAEVPSGMQNQKKFDSFSKMNLQKCFQERVKMDPVIQGKFRKLMKWNNTVTDTF